MSDHLDQLDQLDQLDGAELRDGYAARAVGKPPVTRSCWTSSGPALLTGTVWPWSMPQASSTAGTRGEIMANLINHDPHA